MAPRGQVSPLRVGRQDPPGLGHRPQTLSQAARRPQPLHNFHRSVSVSASGIRWQITDKLIFQISTDHSRMWWPAQWTKQSRSGSVDNESRMRAEDVLARSDRQQLPPPPVIMCNFLIKTQWNLNAYTTTNFSVKFSTNVMLFDIFNEEWNQCFYVATSVKMKGGM